VRDRRRAGFTAQQKHPTKERGAGLIALLKHTQKRERQGKERGGQFVRPSGCIIALPGILS
jgi:hypothetical protein